MSRGKYQVIIGSVTAIGVGIGPLVGGALSEKAGWRVSVASKIFTPASHKPGISGVFGLALQ
jgi:MFS family permease